VTGADQTSTTPLPRVTRPPFPKRYRGPRRRSPGGTARAMQRAIERMADAFAPGLTSPPRPWFKLSVIDGDYDGAATREWMRVIEQKMMEECGIPTSLLDPAVIADRSPWWLESDVLPHIRDYRFVARISNVDVYGVGANIA
jgi:hypothetical protein